MNQSEEMSSNNQMVNHPEHYNTGSIECIDAMISAYGKKDVEIFCRLNAFKYLWRSKYKGKYTEDLEKAIWYTEKAKELSYETI